MAKVLFSRLAESDLDNLLDFIARDKPDAAIQWVSRIRNECEFLARNPESGAHRPEFRTGEFRNRTVGNYVIFYRSIRDGVEIARIVRGERDIRGL